jgi:hypothetical protein
MIIAALKYLLAASSASESANRPFRVRARWDNFAAIKSDRLLLVSEFLYCPITTRVIKATKDTK